jgi:FKBP-type peptidyl-prolyl cis-trans isomerase FkpA
VRKVSSAAIIFHHREHKDHREHRLSSLGFSVASVVIYIRTAFLIVALAVLTSGCNNNNSNPNDPSQVKIEFTTTDLVVGTGNAAVVGNVATVNYTGWLYNGGNPESKGTWFDSSLQPGRTPLVVTIGRLQTIPGFEQGLLGMRVGGKRRVYIPSDLAYGPAGAGNGVIPPNAALVFEIDMVSLVQ